MKRSIFIIGLTLITFYTYSQVNKTPQQDTTKKQSVKVLPNDSPTHRMPIQKADTYRSNMPVLPPKKDKVDPK